MKFVQTTIDSELAMLVSEKKDEKAIYYKDMCFSWKDIDRMADILSAEMLEMQIEKGSHIAIWCSNSPLYLCAFFAIARIGCVSVLINPAYKSYEIDQLLAYADVKGVFCDEVTVKKLRKINSLDFLRYIGSDTLEILQDMDRPETSIVEKLKNRRLEVTTEDAACMLFTSGTTGDAKGVVLTHFQLLNVALRAADAMRWGKEDIVCLTLPLFHCFGMSTGVLAAFYHHGTICMNDSFKSTAVMQCIHRHRCTVLNGVPTMFLSILYNPDRWHYDLTSLNSGIIAGSGVYERDFLKISRELDIPHLMQSYGQTEASPSITFSDYEDPVEERAQSVGIAIPDVDIRIWNLEKDEAAVVGHTGEVEIRGFNTMAGYYKKKEASAEVLREDGWMRTGDMGFLDEKQNLHICGRMKEMIIRGGENIAPQEIEEILLNMEGVRQARVFGVQEAVIQENIAACIETDCDYTKQAVRKYVRKYLADYKVPKYVFFFRKFPENASGKVDVKQLKNEIEQQIKEMKES